MNDGNDLRCPVCMSSLVDQGEAGFLCPVRNERYPRREGCLDLRVELDLPYEPAPLSSGDLQAAFAARDAGKDFKSVLEELLLSVPEIPGDRLMQLLGEGRGAWFPLLRSSGGKLLFVGNALSGTVTALAEAGFEVTVLDPSPERSRFGAFRNDALSPGRTRCFVGGDGELLPFKDGTFDVVVKETGFAGASPVFGHDLAECRRVSRGEVLLIANNRLGYKRSTGRRSILYVPSPKEWITTALRPREGELTLPAHREALGAQGFGKPRAFALYPHASDFTHVVALDEPWPALTVGPMERRNRLKLLARRAGLFPVFAPSFALFSARGEAAQRSRRIDRVLEELARILGEPAPGLHQLVATRGNSAILHTRPPGAGEGTGPGCWTLHLPLNPKNRPQTERHFAVLQRLRRDFASVPAPEPLHLGRVDGVMLSCERRLAGWTAPQITGDRARVARMLADAAAHLVRLVVRPAAPFTEEDFRSWLAPRFDLVIAHAAVASTVKALERLREESRERLVGRRLPRVLYHADLRAKHVQVDAEGRVLGYLDWGTAEDEGLPYFDLFHLLAHQRKQEQGLRIGEAWRLLRERSRRRTDEEAALSAYASALELDAGVVEAMEMLYPVLVGAMAEKNWDYSRPRWLHRHFGL